MSSSGLTLDEARRLVDRALCERCQLPRDAGAHMTRNAATCRYKLDREALAQAIVRAASPVLELAADL